MLRKFPLFSTLFRVRKAVILGVLAATLLFTAPVAERYGDRLQIVLPVLALGCSVLTGSVGEYMVRLVGLEVVVHSTKLGLGERPINQRPDGGYKGFPSGHTAAASFGASALVHECIGKSPFVKGVVILGAAFTGASRIEADKHNIWQVLAGALTGWGIDRVLRQNTPMRKRLNARVGAILARRRAKNRTASGQ